MAPVTIKPLHDRDGYHPISSHDPYGDDRATRGMGDYTAKDPIVVESKTVNASGNLYLGNDFAGREVKFIIETVGDAPETDRETDTE